MIRRPLVTTLASIIVLAAPVSFAGEAECLEEVARIRNSEMMACYLSHGPKSGEFTVQQQEPLTSCLREARVQYLENVYNRCNFAAEARGYTIDNLGSFSY